MVQVDKFVLVGLVVELDKSVVAEHDKLVVVVVEHDKLVVVEVEAVVVEHMVLLLL